MNRNRAVFCFEKYIEVFLNFAIYFFLTDGPLSCVVCASVGGLFTDIDVQKAKAKLLLTELKPHLAPPGPAWPAM